MAPSPRRRRHVLLLLPLLLAVAALQGAAPATGAAESCKEWLVQSIPTDMPHLRRVPGVLSTADVLQCLPGNTRRSRHPRHRCSPPRGRLGWVGVGPGNRCVLLVRYGGWSCWAEETMTANRLPAL